MDTLQDFRRVFDTLLKRAARIWRRKNNAFEYVRIYEHHDNGAIHAHLLVCGLSPFVRVTRYPKRATKFTPVYTRPEKKGYWLLLTWWKKTCEELGLGYQVDIRKIEDGDVTMKAVYYCTKYMTKQAQNYETHGIRRIQSSQGIGALPNRPKPANVWEFRNIGIYRHDIPEGYVIYDKTIREGITGDYWLTHYSYPPIVDIELKQD
jgi:hypothetical protein